MLAIIEKSDLLRGTGVTINAIHPGTIKSGIGKSDGGISTWLSTHVIDKFMASPDTAAKLIHNLACSPEFKTISGRYFNKAKEKTSAAHTTDRILSRQVYELSMILTGLDTELRS